MAGNETYPDPADHPEVQKNWLPALVQSGHDPLHRMVFADWLQDHGYDNAAVGQRWAAKYNRKPDTDPTTNGWYPSIHDTVGHHNSPAVLPRDLFFRYRANHPTYETPAEEARFNLWNMVLHGEAGGIHEKHFLSASHYHKWDSENNEPIGPGE